MAQKPIKDLASLTRPLLPGDLLVIETADGTFKFDAALLTGADIITDPNNPGGGGVVVAGQQKKYLHTSAGGESVITVPGFTASKFSVVFKGVQPLDEFLGDPAVEPVPSGSYFAKYATSEILLGDAAEGGEKYLILHS